MQEEVLIKAGFGSSKALGNRSSRWSLTQIIHIGGGRSHKFPDFLRKMAGYDYCGLAATDCAEYLKFYGIVYRREIPRTRASERFHRL